MPLYASIVLRVLQDMVSFHRFAKRYSFLLDKAQLAIAIAVLLHQVRVCRFPLRLQPVRLRHPAEVPPAPGTAPFGVVRANGADFRHRFPPGSAMPARLPLLALHHGTQFLASSCVATREIGLASFRSQVRTAAFQSFIGLRPTRHPLAV